MQTVPTHNLWALLKAFRLKHQIIVCVLSRPILASYMWYCWPFSTLQAAGHLLGLLGPGPSFYQERGCPSNRWASAHCNQPWSKWDIILLQSLTHSHTQYQFIIQWLLCLERNSFLCRSCVVVPGLEWELFRELSAPLPGEPSIAAQVLFQVSHFICPQIST